LADRYFFIDVSTHTDVVDLNVYRTFFKYKEVSKNVLVPVANASIPQQQATDQAGNPVTKSKLIRLRQKRMS
jgi:hypothetical protein